jgi:aminoglycoside phosphotransferase (APT) family kinase protein
MRIAAQPAFHGDAHRPHLLFRDRKRSGLIPHQAHHPGELEDLFETVLADAHEEISGKQGQRNQFPPVGPTARDHYQRKKGLDALSRELPLDEFFVATSRVDRVPVGVHRKTARSQNLRRKWTKRLTRG